MFSWLIRQCFCVFILKYFKEKISSFLTKITTNDKKNLNIWLVVLDNYDFFEENRGANSKQIGGVFILDSGSTDFYNCVRPWDAGHFRLISIDTKKIGIVTWYCMYDILFLFHSQIISDEMLHLMILEPGNDVGNIVAWKDFRRPSRIPEEQFSISKRDLNTRVQIGKCT